MRRETVWQVALVATILWLTGAVVYNARQEQPTGWLRGKVVAEETGQPIPGANITLRLFMPLEEGDNGVFTLRTRRDGSFKTKRIPAGAYLIEASSRAHKLRVGTRVVVPEARPSEPLVLELSPLPPFFYTRIQQRVFTPEETPQLMGHGFVPGYNIDFSFYRIDPEALQRSRGNLRQVLYGEHRMDPGSYAVDLGLEKNPALKLLSQSSARITQRDVEGVFHQRFDLPVREPGVYLVVSKADSIQKMDWFLVTRLGLIIKQWGNEALAYVTDLKSGVPVAGAKVVFAAQGGANVSGTSDEHGIFRARLPKPGTNGAEEDDFSGGQSLELMARAEKEGSQAFLVESIWQEAGEGEERIFSYTDRPVYRPGHKVYFKGITRRYADNNYTVLSGKPVEVKVMDPRDTLVYRGRLTSNQFGSYDGEFTLNEEATTGYYRLISTIEGRPQESGFKVAEYRKPEYTVEVTTDKKRYIRGETIGGSVSARYFFGAPVAGAEVSYNIRRSPYWYYPPEMEEEESYQGEGDYEGDGGEYYGYGEVIASGSATTDADGVAKISAATKPATLLARRSEAQEEPQDYQYTIEATVTDPSRKEVTAEGSTIVTQGEFTLSVSPDRYIAAPDEASEIAIEAKDYDGRPIAGAQVEVTAEQESWSRGETEYETAARGNVTTDSQGKAAFRFTPKEQGSFRLQARAHDRRGNRIQGATYLWVTGEFYADMEMPYPTLQIVADKKVYRRGDTAVLLINTKSKGATALLTVEGPQLFEYRLLELKGNSTRVELPIKPEYAPNFFISVVFVHDKEFAQAERRIKVSVEERGLRIEVTPNKPRYTPGEEATYQLRTLDWQGKPVSAEVSVGVVDESVYSVQADNTPPMLSFFYPPRENRVYTAYSFPQIYLDADKETVGIKVRRKFPDTAFWNPSLVTDVEGRGSFSFEMPDSLTTWRATVRGATRETAVGEQLVTVKCSKSLLVRLEAPRFFVQKDRLVLSAVVHNYTQQRQDLRVWVDAPGIRFAGGERDTEAQRFVLEPEGVQRQDWQIEIPSPGTREITVYVKAESGLSDAMALPIPALPHGRERVDWRSGIAQQHTEERLIIRADAVKGGSDLRIRLSPSLASVMFGALEYLAEYPYGCTEQTMSAFLPDVFVARALKELNISNPELQRKLPDMVQKGLNRLYRFQHDDGGWGWWRYDDSDLWMTSYVAFGLLNAKESGYGVNESALDRGLSWLEQQAARPFMATPDRVYMLYVLSLAGRDGGVDRQVMQLYRNANSLDNHSLALLAATLRRREHAAEAQAAASLLWSKAQETQALTWWAGYGDWGRAGETETTALAFRALLASNPQDARLAKVMRWLVLRREGNHWSSTRDTAFVVYALTDFLRQSQELRPDYQATVTLNGKQLLARHFGPQEVFNPEVEIRASGNDLKAGDNLLVVEKRGSGALYYTAIVRQFVEQEDLPLIITGAGITVQRAYYAIESRRDPHTGVITSEPSAQPITEFRAGQPVLVKLTINSPKQYEYLVLEDPLPAGCEVSERGDLEPWEWDWWWSDMEVRDEKTAFFARTLAAGTSTIEYHLRPQIPGDYHVMPTQIYSMYNPEIRGSGAETRVKLR